MKRYKKVFTEEMYTSPSRTDSFLVEAVYRPDKYLQKLLNELDDLILHYKDKQFNSPITICKILSKYYEVNNITFTYGGNGRDLEDKDQSGILEGETGSSSTKINVICSSYIDSIFIEGKTQTEFKKDFKIIIGHELNHRAQFLAVQKNTSQKNINAYINKKPLPAYYSTPHEIMSYAWQIIEDLRFQGADDNEILKFINNKGNYKTYTNNIFTEIYVKIHSNDSVYKRLVKYMYEYLKGDKNKNVI